MKSFRSLALAALALGGFACKPTPKTIPHGTWTGSPPIALFLRTGQTSSTAETTFILAFDEGREQIGFALPYGGGTCRGDVRVVNDAIVADALRCSNPYAPQCAFTPSHFILDRQADGTLTSRVFTYAIAATPECTSTAGARAEFQPGTFRLVTPPTPPSAN